MMFADTFNLALESMRVARVLGLFVPYTLILSIAFLLLNGRSAPELRNRITIFTASLVIGMFISTTWMILISNPELESRRVLSWYDVVPNPDLLTTMLWLIALITGGLCAHALIYIVSGLCALPRNSRNRDATIMIGIALVTAFIPPLAQAKLWSHTHHSGRLEQAYADVTSSLVITDRLTAQWADESPGTWHFLVLRANYLEDAGRVDEAAEWIDRVLGLPDTDLPDRTREWLIQRRRGAASNDWKSAPKNFQ